MEDAIMAVMTPVVQVKFYQIRNEGETLDSIAEKFKVSKNNIEVEKPQLEKGDMVVLRNA
jgi:transcriptional regulator